MVTLANLTLSPEFRVPLDGMDLAQSQRLITLSPRLICQQSTATTTAQTCGGGAEIGLQTHSADGTTTASAQILSDWIDGQTRTSGQRDDPGHHDGADNAQVERGNTAGHTNA